MNLIRTAAAGGGGRGHYTVSTPAQFEETFRLATDQSQNLFQNSEVIVEKKLSEVRHVELQIFCDGKQGVHHLGTRDCSIQRRYQKIIEEVPAALEFNSSIQSFWPKIQASLLKLGYIGPGTLEFIWDVKSKQIYFLEMICFNAGDFVRQGQFLLHFTKSLSET